MEREELKRLIVGLSLIKGVGSQTVGVVLKRISGSVDELWKMSVEELGFLLKKNRIPFANQLSEEIISSKEKILNAGKERLKELRDRGIDLLVSEEIPKKLREIPDAPYWLFVQGNKELLFDEDKLFVAIVGTRSASILGKRFTKRVVQVLSIYPVVVVSGLARGIDEAAHIFSLEKKIPNIAFLGCGIELVFPRSTKKLRDEIIRLGGVIVSEYLPRESYAKYKFVLRNRLQAAISDLIIPVEAKERSGTAYTVNFGIKYNKIIWGIKLNSGIESLLRKKEIPIFDISTDEGIREIDYRLQKLIEDKGIFYDKVSYMLNCISNSLRLRYLSKEDKLELVERIKKLVGLEG